MANQIGAVPEVAERIATALYAGIAAGRFVRADVVYLRPQGQGSVGIARLSLLPLDLQRFLPEGDAEPPLTGLPWQMLAGAAGRGICLCAALQRGDAQLRRRE